MSDLLSSVLKLVEEADEFPEMDTRRQAAFRARVTRYLNQVEDGDVRQILLDIQAEVGTAAKKASQKLTAVMIETEFPQFAGYDTPQRAAYKAKTTRLLNEAVKGGDEEATKRLKAIQEQIATFEKKEAKGKLLKAAKSRQKAA